MYYCIRTYPLACIAARIAHVTKGLAAISVWNFGRLPSGERAISLECQILSVVLVALCAVGIYAGQYQNHFERGKHHINTRCGTGLKVLQ
jgi:hypothetical protein